MDANLRRYPVYQAARGALFWLPVFFLYLQSVVSAGEVLALEAIYYVSVVALEVPSGYLSDRVGRRPTLVVSAACAVAAHVVFAATGSFASFAVAQVLLAGAMAFNSGTDSALLFDSLAELGRSGEIAEREGRAEAVGFLAVAASALVGGAVAAIDLRLAYVLSAVGAAVALLIALGFHEPPRRQAAEPPLAQLGAVGRAMRTPVLAWVFAYAVAMTVFVHVPYELVQPYVEILLAEAGADLTFTPIATGVVLAVTMGVSALASVRVGALAATVGPVRSLLLAMLLIGAIMIAMAAAVHPLVLVPLLVRGVPQAIAQPLERSLVHPRIGSGIRATYLSLQSFAGRLAFAGALALAAAAVGDLDRLAHPAMRELLLAVVAVLAGLLLVLAILARTKIPGDGSGPPAC